MIQAPEMDPRTRDELLADDWRTVSRFLEIMCSRVANGGHLHIKRLYPGDPVELTRVGVIRMLDRVLASAIVDEPETDHAP